MTPVRAVLSDVDGVVRRGSRPVPGAVDGLRRTRLPVRYLTNNASRSASEVAGSLARMGASCRPDDVVTSGVVAADDARERVGAGASVLVVGAPALTEAVTSAGLEVVPPGPGSGTPVAVVQGWGPDVRAQDLADAACSVASGALWVATNLDATLPTDRGPVPGNGTLVRAVAAAVGRDPDVVSGKPGPGLYRRALASLGLEPGEVLAVGDRLDTDVAGARAAGIRAALVLSGVCGLDDALAAPPGNRPDLVLPDLSWLPRLLDGDRAATALCDAVRLVHVLRDAGENVTSAEREAHRRMSELV